MIKKIWYSGWKLRDSRITPFIVLIFLFVLWWITGGSRPTVMDFLWSATCDADCIQRAKHWTAPEIIDDSSKAVQYIHQSWKTTDLPKRFARFSLSWRKCFPSAKFILWTDDDNMNFIAKHYPWFLNRYLAFPSNIFRVDSVRYFYLLHYGGIYADLDTECLRPFDHLLQSPVVLGAMEGKANIKEGYVQNSFMYSTRGHPLWTRIVHQIENSWNRRAPEYLTGPNALAAAIKSYRKETTKNDIVIFPPEYFNPFSWMTNTLKSCKDNNAMSEVDLANCRKAFLKESYVIQYHAHTWRMPVIM